MIPYLLLTLFVTVTAYVGRLSGNRLIGRASLVIAGAVLVAFAGFRDYRIGTDTGNYVYQFSQIYSLDSALEKSTEVGYNVLVWLASSASDSYASLLILIATVVIVLYVSTIVRFVKHYETGLYLFVALGSYTFLFNGARQAIAAAICFWAIRFILDRRFIPYAAAISVAMLFHKTALVALPLYFLAAPKFRLSRLAALTASAVALTGFLSVFVYAAAYLLDDRFAIYKDVTQGGGEILTAFLAGQGAVLIWFRSFVKENQEVYTRLLNIYLIALVPAIVSVISSLNPSGPLRLQIYFSAVSILMWPMIFRQIRDPRQRGLIGGAFVVVTMAFFIMTTSTFSGLTPYRLNEVFS